MEMQKVVSIGDKVDLKQIKEHLKEDESLPVYPSRILDLKENNVMQLAMPYLEGRIVPLAVKDKYEICVYAKNGLYMCNGVIIERYKTGNMFYLDAAIYTDFKKVQRREYYRYAYRTNVEYCIASEKQIRGEHATTDDNGAGDNKTGDKETWYNGIIMDLSGGGLRMVCDGASKMDDFIQLRFPIRTAQGAEIVYIYGKILRSMPMENNPKLRDYRIEFVNISTSLQEKIIRFIFEEERRSLSKGKQS